MIATGQNWVSSMKLPGWAAVTLAAAISAYTLLAMAATPTDRLAVIPPAIEGTAGGQNDAVSITPNPAPAQRSARCGDGFCTSGETSTSCRVDCPGVAGVCGPSHTANVSAYPTGGSACGSGLQADVDSVGNDGAFNWNCAGTTGGATSNCFAVVNRNGQCGAANGTTRYPAPTGSAACATGIYAGTDTAGTDGTYNWNCNGSGSGASVSCAANVQSATNGACGSSNGSTVNPQPSGSAACAEGTFTEKADTATDYQWDCTGAGGGTVASCSAIIGPATINAACGSANGSTQATHPSGSSACSAGGYSESPDTSSTWNWGCSGIGGGSSTACSATRPINGACGPAAGTTATAQPTGSAACTAGNFSDTADTATLYNWSCTGSGGGTSSACTANRSSTETGICGSANGVGTPTYPTSGHCSSGTLSTLDSAASDGSFNWSCLGSGGGDNDSCYAPKSRDGLCGTSHTRTVSAPPTGAQLCSVGAVTDFSSAPNYTWKCAGTGGGNSPSCFANRPSSNGTCGTANLSTQDQQPFGTAACGTGEFREVADTTGTWRWACDGTNGGTSQTCSAVQGPGAPAFQPEKIVMGDLHTCALMKNRTVRCWGNNADGQLGTGGTPTFSPKPLAVPGLANVQSLVVGFNTTCALLGDGTVRCWGRNLNGDGACGDGTTTNCPSPVTPTGLTGVTQIQSSDYAFCALRNTGQVWCWGFRPEFDGDMAKPVAVLTPRFVPEFGSVSSLIPPFENLSTAVIKNDGTRLVSGYRGNAPVNLTIMNGALHFVTANGNACAIRSGSSMFCECGFVDFGECGNGVNSTSSVDLDPPEYQIPGLEQAFDVALSYSHSCAAKPDRSVWCWGKNDLGSLGVNSTQDTVLIPRQVPGLPSIDSIQVNPSGYPRSCAYISNGNNVYCWGLNFGGAIGDGTTVHKTSPVLITY